MHRKFLCSSLPAMARSYSASEAARALGISLDTLRRWDRQGRIRVERDSANRRTVPAEEIARLRGSDEHALSARNRFRGIVREVKIEGLLAQVELDVTEPARLVAVITRDAAEGPKYPALRFRDGLVRKPAVFATNRLVLIVPRPNPAALRTVYDLRRAGVKLVIGDPAVPIGSYTRQILDTLGITSEVLKN